MHDAYIVVESGGVLGTVMKIDVDTLRAVDVVDADGDGLIEIGTLAGLNNVRHNLTGITYRIDPDVFGVAGGCPAGGCRGYELTTDLDFDADGDGSTWTRNSDGSVTLDVDDNNDIYFDIASAGSSGGWVPIGDNSSNNSGTRFTAVFEGNGNTITGLATVRDLTYIGLFGTIGAGADIRNLGLVGNLAKRVGSGSAAVGGLVGFSRGSITASYATGDADGGPGEDYVGGLVGGSRGTITASYATGDADGGAGDGDDVGGLVGSQDGGGSITASYATGDVDGGAGDDDYVGGLVGQGDGSITASYATGDADGGSGVDDSVGGLVGWQDRGSSITASYSIGDANGGAGDDDRVGGLVGNQRSGSITASWGFGSMIGEVDGIVGSDGNSDRPNGVSSADDLTATNVPASWNEAASNTMGAWDLGTTSQPPALSYADYDGATVGTAGSYTSGHRFHCASDSADVPEGAVIIPGCGTLLPSVAPADVLTTRADIIVISGTAGTAYIAVLADGAVAPTAAAIKAASAGSGGVVVVGSASVAASTRATVSLTGLSAETMYDAYIFIESGTDVFGKVMKVDLDTIAIVTAANVLATTADINVVSGTVGTAYVAVLADGAMAPTAAAVKAATAGSGGVVVVGSSAVTAGTRTRVSLTGLMESSMYDAYIVIESNGVLGTVMKVDLNTLRLADADGDGLIEIGTLAELYNVRHNMAGTTYRVNPNVSGDASGCPAGGCFGYELTADLDFDSDGDGSTWTRNSDGSITLDTDDHNSDYFGIYSGISSGGWEPIGGDSSHFTAVFEGNGHTISGLASVRSGRHTGLFGVTRGAHIRNLGLVGNLAKGLSRHFGGHEALREGVGGLVGQQRGGSITASYTTGRAEGGDGIESVGGLVGQLNGGIITTSYATGDADGAGRTDDVGGLVGWSYNSSTIIDSHAAGNVDGGGGDDRVGGLVGRQVGSLVSSGRITASYATGDVDGGGGDDRVGGLVGWGGSITASYATGNVSGQNAGGLVGRGGSITASYATGDADGGAGRYNSVGGLVGSQDGGGSITASYATGDADGGPDRGDWVGGLVGSQGGGGAFTASYPTASWGFGSKAGGENDGIDGSNDRPNGITSATDLIATNVPDEWNETDSNTLGAWDFGIASQTPALNYADYDGSTVGTAGSYTGGHNFHCASDSDNAPDDAILIPNCGTLIPGQRRTQPSPAPSGYGSGYVDLSGSSRSSSIQQGFHYASASLWVPEDESGTSADTSTDKKDSSEDISLIATFDSATDDLAAIRASTGRDADGKDAAGRDAGGKYALTGIFANPTLANWNNFDGQSDSAHVGSASVSTWQIGTMVEAQATGSIRINGVAIEGDYINFLMAGGGDGANVGVSIYAAGADANIGTALTAYSPNFCADKYLKGEQHWAHFDVRDLKGKVVNIEIRDHDATNDCGFITFDHFYQSDNHRGARVGMR